TWTEDKSSVTAEAICENNEEHKVTETVNTTVKETPATCVEAGKTVYTATFKNELFEEQTEEVTIPATGHKYGEPTYEWSEDNKTVTAKAICENDPTHILKETVNTTVQETTATCETAGKTVYTATFKNELFEEQKKEVVGEPLGHDYGAPVYVWAEDNSSVTATMTCANDETHVITETAEVTVTVKEPTATREGLKTYTAEFENEAFEKQVKTEVLPRLDYKFALEVSSKDSQGNDNAVTAVVDKDYVATLTIDEGNVNTSNVAVGVWLKNVLSLGVEGERHYGREFQTGLNDHDVSLDRVVTLFAGLRSATVIGKIGEESVSYKVLNEGRKITGTPDSTENARAVWQAIIKDHIVAETKSDEDSKIVLPAGSYLQVGTSKLVVKTDAVIDNITDPEALEEQIRAALTLEEAEEAIENLVIYVEPGTELWLGNSKASLAEDQDAKITIDINGYEESNFAAVLEELRDAGTLGDLIKSGLDLIEDLATVMDGKTTTVEFEFGHKWSEEPEWTWAEDLSSAEAAFACANNEAHDKKVEATITEEVTTPATCEEEGVKTLTATVEFEGETYTDTKTEAIEAIGHKYGEPTYEWSEDNKTVTAKAVCENNEEHVVTETVNVTVAETPATCEEAGKTVYTATFENELFEPQTKEEAIPATGHKWGEPTWTWADDASSAKAKFVCENEATHVKELNATIEEEIIKEATYEEDGVKRYTAKVTLDGEEYTDSKELPYSIVTEVPVIIEHPESQTVRSGTAVDFKVVAKGEGLHYQWYFRTSSTGEWTKSTASFATTDTYSLSADAVKTGKSGYQYRVEVYNLKGSVMSNTATLTVTRTPKPVIIKHPESVTIHSGTAAAVFKVVAEGEDLHYQWYYRTSSSGTWAKSTSTCATTDTYTLPASSVISARNGYQYRVVVSNKGGSVISDTATMTVEVTPAPIIIEHPEDQTIRSGHSVSFKVVAQGYNLKYQWYYRTSSTGTWAKSTATCANTDTYTLPASSVISARNGYQYRCVVSNIGGSVISNEATMTVTTMAIPVIIEHPKDQSGEQGQPVSFTVVAEGEELTYQWYYRVSNTAKWSKSTAACANTPTYTIPADWAVKARNGYQYRCVVSNKMGAVTSFYATYTVLLPEVPVIVKDPVSQTVASGTAVSFTVEATGEDISYQWWYRTSSTGTWVKSTAACANTPTYTLDASKVTKNRSGYEYRCRVKNEGGYVDSKAAVLTVLPKNAVSYELIPAYAIA
ncbi:MAG: hypothetical protein IIY75_08150, partial [Erysipelotrichales bacterium]|nr:hypothetical protein [Erysipelotrichales bacterium]